MVRHSGLKVWLGPLAVGQVPVAFGVLIDPGRLAAAGVILTGA